MTKVFKTYTPYLLTAVLIITVVLSSGLAGRQSLASELVSTSLVNDANLKAYYQLEADGTDHQSSYNLTLNNAPSFGSALYANGMDLGSSNNNKYAEISNNMGITNGAISISVWVKLDSEITSGHWGLAGLGNATTYNEYWIDYEYNSGTRRVEFRRSKQLVGEAVQYYNIDLGTSGWHHIVLTYDGTTLYGYVDNNKTTGVAASGNGSGSVLNHFTIGAHNENGIESGSYASAMFDDTAVFNRALTDQEVSSLFAADTVKLITARTADKSIASNTALQEDNELTLSLAHKTYAIDGTIFAKSSTADPEIKFAISATSASSLTIGYIAANSFTHSGGVLTATGSSAVIPTGANGTIPIHISGTVTMSQFGNLALEWAQNVSDADSMVVMKGSYLSATEIP